MSGQLSGAFLRGGIVKFNVWLNSVPVFRSLLGIWVLGVLVPVTMVISIWSGLHWSLHSEAAGLIGGFVGLFVSLGVLVRIRPLVIAALFRRWQKLNPEYADLPFSAVYILPPHLLPNHVPDPTSPSVTPPAGAGGAPSVAADH
jgi:hypothetical protein